jgi:hypothetical protein
MAIARSPGWDRHLVAYADDEAWARQLLNGLPRSSSGVELDADTDQVGDLAAAQPRDRLDASALEIAGP